ncbi:transglycosylase SLT domain-containing protein [Nocardia sp. NPDC004750]
MQIKAPAGARYGLLTAIDSAQGLIQKSVDLLPDDSPSQALDLAPSHKDNFAIGDESKSVMAESYTSHLRELANMKDYIRKRDYSADVSTENTHRISSGTRRAVIQHVEDLQSTLDGAPGPDPGERYIAPDVEAALTSAVLKTVDDVHNEIASATGHVQTYANDIDASTAKPNSEAASAGRSPMQSSYSTRPSSAPFAATTDYTRYQGSTSIDAAIDNALDALGITDPTAREYWKRGYRVLISRESGGNPNAVNNWDSNAAAGSASRGLTQTIPGTFQAYHVAGTSDNIHDPVANVAASMNYVMKRYNVSPDGHDLQAKVQQADPNRSPKGY